MTPDGSLSDTLREASLPRLVQVIVQPYGASMSCYYCRLGAWIDDGDVAGQILLFQEAHFGCDPAIASAIPPRGDLPHQAGRD